MKRFVWFAAAASIGWIGMLVMPRPAAANTLIDLRVGPHKRFDRVVFEFQTAAVGRITALNDRTVEVRFADVKAREGFRLPQLPRGLTVVEKIDAFREGDADLVFEISLSREADPSELPLAGTTWRLAVDFAPRMSDKDGAKPEYVPGDRPIPTKFAEVPPATVDSASAAPPVLVAEMTPQTDDTLDPAQQHAILAFYYLSAGDSAAAAREAELYRQLRGEALALQAEPQTASGVTVPAGPLAPGGKLAALTRVLNLPVGSLLAAIFGVGLLGGLLLKRLTPAVRSPLPRLPRIALPRLPKLSLRRKSKEDRSAELSADMAALDEAVALEPPSKPRAKPESPPVEEPVPVEVPDAEEQAKDSLMDRRVRRVLELTSEGRSIADIAEELHMGQDEVKLILDLNK